MKAARGAGGVPGVLRGLREWVVVVVARWCVCVLCFSRSKCAKPSLAGMDRPCFTLTSIGVAGSRVTYLGGSVNCCR